MFAVKFVYFLRVKDRTKYSIELQRLAAEFDEFYNKWFSEDYKGITSLATLLKRADDNPFEFIKSKLRTDDMPENLNYVEVLVYRFLKTQEFDEKKLLNELT